MHPDEAVFIELHRDRASDLRFGHLGFDAEPRARSWNVLSASFGPWGQCGRRRTSPRRITGWRSGGRDSSTCRR